MAGREARVVVVGSANMDLVFRASRFPAPGETLLGSGFATFPGGKGANQAVAIGRLDGRPLFIGKVGQDIFGKDLLRSLAEAGVDVSGVLQDARYPSGVAGITVDANGQNAIIVALGANDALTAQEVEAALGAANASVLLIQQETPAETVHRALQIARDRGMMTILNPAPARELRSETLALVDFITPNESEAEALTGIRVVDDATCSAAAGRLRDRGVKHVIITLGSGGSFHASPDGCRRYPARRVEVVDTTAAGDAFNGALAHFLAVGRDIPSALDLANAVGALSTTRAGAQSSMPSRAKLEAFLAVSKAPSAAL